MAPGKVFVGPLLDGVAPHMHANGTPLPNLSLDDDHRFVLSKEIPSRVDFDWDTYIDEILQKHEVQVLLN